MFQNFMNTRSWFLIAIFVIGIAAFIPPGAAADNVSYIQVVQTLPVQWLALTTGIV